MRFFLSFLLLSTLAAGLQAEIITEVVEYTNRGQKLQGYMAYDDKIMGKRPGILVVHEWWGHGKYVQRRARELAKLGFVAFALDMYGKGVYAKDHTEAAQLSGLYRGNRTLMVERASAGLDMLKNHPLTNPAKLAAIGYCFGGTTVLEFARQGVDVVGVVSFHGGLSTPAPQKTKNIKAKILVCHGVNDPMVNPEEVRTFQGEMEQAKADWRMITFGNAVHSFTVPKAGKDPSTGMAYNAKADKRSWEAMKDFFIEIF